MFGGLCNRKALGLSKYMVYTSNLKELKLTYTGDLEDFIWPNITRSRHSWLLQKPTQSESSQQRSKESC